MSTSSVYHNKVQGSPTLLNRVDGSFSIKSQGVEFIIPNTIPYSGRIFVSTTNGYRRLRSNEAELLKQNLPAWRHAYANQYEDKSELSVLILRKLDLAIIKLQNFETMYL